MMNRTARVYDASVSVGPMKDGAMGDRGVRSLVAVVDREREGLRWRLGLDWA